MKIHQLSVFLENKPGQMIGPCRLLAREGVDIRTLSLADTQQFGILRLIVSDWKSGAALLREAGYVVNVAEVVAVEVPDRPGGLASVLNTLDSAGISVEYLYSFVRTHGRSALILFRVEEMDAAIKALTESGIRLLGEEDVYQA